MHSVSSPLRDARILFTAPPVYAPRLSLALFSRGARPIHMPVIETGPLRPVDRCAQHTPALTLEQAVLHLADYDLLIFLSRTAVLSFRAALDSAFSHSANRDPLSVLCESGVKIAALGADALTVRDVLKVQVDYNPISATPSGLVDLLSERLSAPCDILVPVPAVVGMREPPVVPNFLRDLASISNENVSHGAVSVTSVPAYRTAPVDQGRIDVELDLLQRCAVDAIVFSSTGEAYALHSILNGTAR